MGNTLPVIMKAHTLSVACLLRPLLLPDALFVLLAGPQESRDDGSFFGGIRVFCFLLLLA